MTKLEDTILNYCGLCRYVELLNQINPFRNHLKFQKFFAVTWPNAGTNNRQVLENTFTQWLLQEIKLQDKIIWE